MNKIPCPVCNHEVDDLLCDSSFNPTEEALIRKVAPYWVEDDGVCRSCVEEIRAQARLIREAFANGKSRLN